MKTIDNYIQEKLVFNKHTKSKTFNSIQELSDKYDFDLFISYLDKSLTRQQFNYKEYKVSNNLFKTNIGDKIIKLDEKEIIQYENDLNYHFKDILNNNYTIKLSNFISEGYVWAIIRIENKNNKNHAQALYDYIKSTIKFKILKDEKEAEKILSNVIDYIVETK